MDQRSSIIWSAGFFDGEGHIAINHLLRQDGNHEYRMKLEVANTVKESLEVLQSLWGGSIYEKKMTSPRYKAAWRWVVSARLAVTALKDMLPFLVIKQERAKLAIEFAESLNHPYRVSESESFIRLSMIAKMRELNQRGVPVETST